MVNLLWNFIKKLYKSIWFFPIILFVLVIVLTTLRVSGSSIGVYNQFFYGSEQDENLLFGRPRIIRSDEWIVSTQMAIAQENNNYETRNNNIGAGQDMSLIYDIPYRDWSTLFKPQNLSFFVLPFEYAFAFRWWFMAYLLVMGAYFFILRFLPGMYLLAIIIALSLFLSPFVQWWYIHATLGCLAYSFFVMLAFTKISDAKNNRNRILWGGVLAYSLVCFILIFYPPFQIPCGIVMLAFCLGYLADQSSGEKNALKPTLLVTVASVAVALSISTLFVVQRQSTVSAIRNSSYPGHRTVESGGYDFTQPFVGHLALVFQSDRRASNFVNGGVTTNQSEASGFVLAALLLLPIMLLKIIKSSREFPRKTIFFIIGALVVFISWLYLPGLDFIGKITLLNRVPGNRLIIGLGLINFILLACFIAFYAKAGQKTSRSQAILYSLALLVACIVLNFYIYHRYTGLITGLEVLLLALPLPIFSYLFLAQKFKLAAGCLLVLSVLSTFYVNPLYRGVGVVRSSEILQSIKRLSAQYPGAWVTENSMTENFALMVGANTFSGVYLYPQPDVWDDMDNVDVETYSRYAHVSFVFDRDTERTTPTSISLSAPDNFKVTTEPCSDFLRMKSVTYLLVTERLAEDEPCISEVTKTVYPEITFYAYRLAH